MSQVGHQAGAYPGFCSMKQLGYSSLDEMLVHLRVTPSIKLAGTHLLYTPGWREALWEKSTFPMNTMQYPRPGLQLGLLNPDMNTLGMRPPHLPI